MNSSFNLECKIVLITGGGTGSVLVPYAAVLLASDASKFMSCVNLSVDGVNSIGF